MKKILSMMKIDVRLITRNPIILFMVISPALLSFAFLAVLGGMGQGTINFVLTENVPQQAMINLEKAANVEIVADEAELVQRVERFDSIAGVIFKDNSYKILLEGNERDSFANQAELLISRAVSNDMPDFISHKVESKGNVIIELTAVSLMTVALFLSSVVSGFNIVSERESKAIKAIAVSPMGLKKFIGARTLTTVLLGLANIALCVVIMGRGENISAVLLSALCSVTISALVALGLGCTASNQIAAIASIKIIMPACLILPMSSYFVPQSMKFFYCWLPNYWQFESLRSAWNGNIDWNSNVAMLITGFIWVAILNKLFSKKLGLI